MADTRSDEPDARLDRPASSGVEDPRLITGPRTTSTTSSSRSRLRRDRAVAPRARPDQEHRHSGAAAAPGVVAVFTGEDFAHLNPLPCAWQAAGIENHVVTPRGARDRQGRAHRRGVAAVVAENRTAGRGRARADRDRLGAARRRRRRREARRSRARRRSTRTRANNIVMDWECGDAEAADDGLAAADVVVTAATRQPAVDPDADGDARRSRPATTRARASTRSG